MAIKTLGAYDFDEDAMGFATFINEMMDAQGDEVSPVVYVVDAAGDHAVNAAWNVRELSDGSKVAELVISFENLRCA